MEFLSELEMETIFLCFFFDRYWRKTDWIETAGSVGLTFTVTFTNGN